MATIAERKALLEAIFNKMPDAVCVLGRDGAVLDVNVSFTKNYGFEKDQVVGKVFTELDLMAEESKRIVKENLQGMICGEENPPYEIRLRTKNGEKRYVEVNAFEMGYGEHVVDVVMLGDITKYKQMEREIWEKNAELDAQKEELLVQIEEVAKARAYSEGLLKAMIDGLAVIDLKGEVTDTNEAFLGMFGLKREEVVGRPIMEVLGPLTEPEELAKASARIGQLMAGIPVRTAEMPITAKGSDQITVSVAQNLVRDAEGNPTMLFILMRDITEHKRMERQLAVKLDELQAAYQKMQEMDQLKDNFLSMVSHELRTPLTSIKGFAEILLDYADEDRETQREFLTIIDAESERLTRLINDLLNLSRIESGKMQWDMAEVSISEVVETAVNATHSLAAKKNLKTEIDLDADRTIVWGDRDKLVQVVTNLLSNAIKFTPDEGEIRVGARVIKGSDGENAPDMIQVSISDTGIGIAPEDYDQVFEKFKQVGDTLTDKPAGTGLGLPICREIVEHFEGKIWVESELGKGSTFYFTLPLMREVRAETREEREVKDRIFANGNKKILVVDDESSIRRFLEHELTSRGYQVIQASDGQEAIDMARSHHPDLITLDVLMPDITGFDVTAVLKNDPDTRDIPILIVSVLEDRDRGYNLGANEYLTKPFNGEALMEKVTSLLGDAPRNRVLVVDDDRSLVKIIEFELQKRGLVVDVAYDGDEALKAVQNSRPDLIVLDLIMPNMDGYAVMKALKESEDTAHIPIVVLTGVEIDGGRVQAISLGATEYLTKSGDLKKLFSTVESIIGVETAA